MNCCTTTQHGVVVRAQGVSHTPKRHINNWAGSQVLNRAGVATMGGLAATSLIMSEAKTEERACWNVQQARIDAMAYAREGLVSVDKWPPTYS